VTTKKIWITDYDPVTGRGIYQEKSGQHQRFRYTDFKEEKAVWPKRPGRLEDGKISKGPWYDNLYWYFWRAIWLLRRVI